MSKQNQQIELSPDTEIRERAITVAELLQAVREQRVAVKWPDRMVYRATLADPSAKSV